jgi:hypothetical protein
MYNIYIIYVLIRQIISIKGRDAFLNYHRIEIMGGIFVDF